MSALHTAAREALYAQRDTIAQGGYFVRHMSAMTGERLRAKSDIAAELAHRDMEIDRLRAALDAGQAQRSAFEQECADALRCALEALDYCIEDSAELLNERAVQWGSFRKDRQAAMAATLERHRTVAERLREMLRA